MITREIATFPSFFVLMYYTMNKSIWNSNMFINDWKYYENINIEHSFFSLFFSLFHSPFIRPRQTKQQDPQIVSNQKLLFLFFFIYFPSKLLLKFTSLSDNDFFIFYLLYIHTTIIQSTSKNKQSVEQREACKSYEKVLVQNICFNLPKNLTDAIEKISRYVAFSS